MENRSSDVDYEKAYEELRMRALQLYPELERDIETFSSNHAASEMFQKYQAALNEAPSLVSSNQSK
jgi:hypothetical protein